MKQVTRFLAFCLILCLSVQFLPVAARADEANEEEIVNISEDAAAEELAADPELSQIEETEEAALTEDSEAAELSATSATSGDCGADGASVQWSLSGGTLTISGTGAMADYKFYSYVPWYDDEDSITKVIIGNGITRIGNYSFFECGALEDVEIGEDVTSIGGYAFGFCSSLTSIKIPEGVTSIEEDAFMSCEKLNNVSFPTSVTTIGEGRFLNAGV